MTRLARLRRSLEELFPERLLYIHTGEGDLKAIVLSPRKQMAAAVAVAGCALWLGVGTAAVLVNALELTRGDRELARTEAKYERWIADRQARLNSAMAQLNDTGGSMGVIAADVEKRHAALALLLTEVKDAPGAAEALAPALAQAQVKPNASPLRRVEMVRLSQEKLLDAADSFAKGRADRLRLAFRLAGLTPAAYMPEASNLGGPLIEDGDPRALAAVLDVDEDFAERVQHAATGLSEARALRAGLDRLPLGKPTEAGARSSGFGVRMDPFTRRPAFHSGLDFPGAVMTPVESTGPGVVAFTGVRSGYGNVVEVDHGGGLKTRYAHLSSIGVRVGERVAVGQRLGGMGSTGRSTGPHLHYEVWLKGRPQNPDRFVKAGEYVLKNS
jgi:murein DD-endopeptidase MepM/ murein hydrolase activator NlpD